MCEDIQLICMSVGAHVLLKQVDNIGVSFSFGLVHGCNSSLQWEKFHLSVISIPPIIQKNNYYNHTLWGLIMQQRIHWYVNMCFLLCSGRHWFLPPVVSALFLYVHFEQLSPEECSRPSAWGDSGKGGEGKWMEAAISNPPSGRQKSVHVVKF